MKAMIAPAPAAQRQMRRRAAPRASAASSCATSGGAEGVSGSALPMSGGRQLVGLYAVGLRLVALRMLLRRALHALVARNAAPGAFLDVARSRRGERRALAVPAVVAVAAAE